MLDAMPNAEVLLVEDDAELAGLVERKLRAAGLIVVWAANAEVAVEALRARVFDAVWADFNLGGTSTGADVLRTAATLLPRAPLFLVTGATPPAMLPAGVTVLDKKDLANALQIVLDTLRRSAVPPRL